MKRLLWRSTKLFSSRWAVDTLRRCGPGLRPTVGADLRTTLHQTRLWTTTSGLSLAHIDNSVQRATSVDAAERLSAKETLLAREHAVRATLAVPTSGLPLMCPGCGAPSQTVNAEAPGYYGRTKTQRPSAIAQKSTDEDVIFAAALDRGALEQPQLPNAPVIKDNDPICDRCHHLIHHNIGTSIEHPSVDSIREMIEESPYRYNHIYHVIDAVDFPMSIIPNLASALRLPRMRTQNRRSKHVTFIKGRVAEVSFIITRADLLAPKKEQVDTLLPYMRDILRDALGRMGRNVRLGNVRMVSAKRGWWTPVVKEEIFKRGGAGWMVGKVNVGKSSLMEVIYPKGRRLDKTADARSTQATPVTRLEQLRSEQPALDNMLDSTQGGALISSEPQSADQELARQDESTGDVDSVSSEQDFIFDESELALLPPRRKEEPYPVMPIVSALPGTTASPIRLPFGNGRGELVDLPGIERSALAEFVLPQHHKQMVMHHRVVPEQKVIRPGQSLLLGGIIRITPKTDGLIVLMYAFVPETFRAHATNTEKAVAIQTGLTADGTAYEGNVQSNATPDAKSRMKSAGVFKLEWDVTKRRTGPLTSNSAGKMKPSNLPFMVHAMDLVIEGVGWVEISAQTRRPGYDPFGQQQLVLPEVEVFTPNGAFVTCRRPMNAWTLGAPPKGSGRQRPRQTMSYKRRMEGGRMGGPRSSNND